jgi:DNA repair protein SbcC/Rad50
VRHLKGIRIKGFQSHTDSYVPLAPGLTVITGESDNGKTSIIRTVRWVALGEPQGDAFRFKIEDEETGKVIREAEEVLVTLEGDDGVEVTKKRRNGKTTYQLSTIAEPFAKAEVPEEVAAWLGIKTHRFGDFETDLNFAYQLAPPFLISETASAGAKILGKLSGTEAVDLAIKDVAKDTHAARTARSQAEKEIEQREAELQQYEGVDDLQLLLNGLENTVQSIEIKHQRKVRLGDLQTLFRSTVAQLQAIGQRLDTLAIIPSLEEDLQDIEKAQQRYDRLLDLYGQYNQLALRIRSLEDQLEGYQTLEHAARIMDEVDGSHQRLDTLKRLSISYQKHAGDVNGATAILERIPDLGIISASLDGLENDVQRMERLWFLQAGYNQHDATAKRLDGLLVGFKGLAEAVGTLQQVEIAQQRLDRLQRLQQDYKTKDNVAQSAAWTLEGLEADAREAEAELTAAWEAAGNVCPLCERPMHEGGGCG